MVPHGRSARRPHPWQPAVTRVLPAMRKPVKVAVVGCGRAALALHLPALARIRKVEIAGVADPSPEALEAARRGFGVERLAADHRELLEDRSIDAVCVTAPVDAHAEIALAALAAGKHVLVEKPLAAALDECDALVDAARGSGRVAAIGFNQRHHRIVERAHEVVSSGALGEPLLLRSSFGTPELVRAGGREWRRDPAQGGGLVLGQAIHHIDLWRFLLDDEVVEVSARLASGAPGPEAASRPAADGETALLSAVTAGGICVTGDVCSGTAPVNELSIHGSEGRLSFSLYRFDRFELQHGGATGGEPGVRLRRAPAVLRGLASAVAGLRRGGEFATTYERQWRRFLAAIAGDAAPGPTFEDGREATRIALAALASAARGGPIPVAEAPRSRDRYVRT